MEISEQVAVKSIIGKKILDAGMMSGKWYIKINPKEKLADGLSRIIYLELTDGQIQE